MNNFKLTDPIDIKISTYLDLDNPKSFLLFAGAGSGKTRTLVNVLQELKAKHLHKFIQSGQRVAIITYTNAACDEIKHRLQHDPVFKVSTIHSFTWDLIKPFTADIREWLEAKLMADIAELNAKLAKARDLNGKTALKNAKSRDSKQRRLDELASITSFVYSAASNKSGKGVINHSEVIAITANFLTNQTLMQKILVNRFPILLIDESQDTNKDLLEACIETQKNNQDKFCIGLFGDMMQRIYGGGKQDLDTDLPSDWEKPAKKINYRCPKRVVTLINNIRSSVDTQQQEPFEKSIDGCVRLFIIDASAGNKSVTESKIRNQMSQTTTDEMWSNLDDVKCLTLEHAMAAKRGEFDEFFMPLHAEDKIKNDLLSGSGTELKFVLNQVLPLIKAITDNDDFVIVNLIKKYSSLLKAENVKFEKSPIDSMRSIDADITELNKIIEDEQYSFLKILKYIHTKKLLILPDKFLPHVANISEEEDESEEDAALESPESKAWNMALKAKLSHVKRYAKYIIDELGFDTHQGVKGLEFERVMVILDDEEANGFLFSYEKLFGAKALTAKDISNDADGIDSTPARTRRLFYVTCSRAEKSLAVVAYTQDQQAVNKHAIDSGWFSDNEIILL
ncbi:MAG: ATP-dependent helicase [Alteromonadaceae bacterium]|nr:ATP-dependent helicase [Alteromonadaceae bacterium]